jgi:hypothetical protein
LAPANRLWFRVGLLLHRVVNPVIMAGLFYVVLTPFAVVRRVLRPGSRRAWRVDRRAMTYWVASDTRRTRMTDQF